MTKLAHADVLDGSLLVIKNNATAVRLVKGYVPGDNYAAVVAKTVGSAALTAADFTISTDGSSNRVLTSAAKTGTVTADTAQYDLGTATAGAASTLTDAAKTWTANVQANRAVTITGGTGAGQSRRIVSNTGTALTVESPWATQPDATSVYRITDNLVWAFTDGTRVLWLTDETTKQVLTTGNPLNVPVQTYASLLPT